MSSTNNVAEIRSATIEWGSDESTSDKSQLFSVVEPFDQAPSVFVNRTKSGSKNILPVTETTVSSYTIDRNSDIDGTQPFTWMGIANKGDIDTQTSYVVSSRRTIAARIQWGSATSRNDDSEYFPFHDRFTTGCFAVILQRTKANTKSTLPVVDITDAGFKIDRNNGIDGDQTFDWIAVGDCLITSSDCFEIDLGNGNVLKGGIATSTSDGSQTFNFADYGLTPFGSECTCVVTNRTKSGAKDILPVTALLADGFVINRNNDINGDQDFYWLALGKD